MKVIRIVVIQQEGAAVTKIGQRHLREFGKLLVGFIVVADVCLTGRCRHRYVTEVCAREAIANNSMEVEGSVTVVAVRWP